VVEVFSRDGGERALVACLPFLSQRHVVRADELMGSDGFEHQQLYADRMQRLTAALCAGFTDPATVHLVAAHCMVAGATTVGSERAGHTVFDYAINATAFPAGLHYVALGHLHRSQAVAGPVPAWYSGSPLQLDFGEAGEAKSVVLVDAVAGRPALVQPVPLQSGRRLRVFEGTLAELRAAPPAHDDWVKVRLREPARAGLADEVRAVAPSTVDVEVLGERAAAVERAARRHGRTPPELFHDYLHECSIADPRMEALFVELLGEVSAP
jgi:exonuclease SbcD